MSERPDPLLTQSIVRHYNRAIRFNRMEWKRINEHNKNRNWFEKLLGLNYDLSVPPALPAPLYPEILKEAKRLGLKIEQYEDYLS